MVTNLILLARYWNASEIGRPPEVGRKTGIGAGRKCQSLLCSTVARLSAFVYPCGAVTRRRRNAALAMGVSMTTTAFGEGDCESPLPVAAPLGAVELGAGLATVLRDASANSF